MTSYVSLSGDRRRLERRPEDEVVTSPECLVSTQSARQLIDEALDNPIASPPLETLVRPGERVLIVVSDETRYEPRAEFIAAIRERLPAGCPTTIAVATGTHRATQTSLDLPLDLPVIIHDGNLAQSAYAFWGTTQGKGLTDDLMALRPCMSYSM